MQGTIRKQRSGYQWMRLGSAEARFSSVGVLVALTGIICLAFWGYSQLSQTGLRPLYFIALYLAAAVLYLNLGMWVHEQLHCLLFTGRIMKDDYRSCISGNTSWRCTDTIV